VPEAARRTPRPNGRGPIEAPFPTPPVSYIEPTPRPNGRGPIEADSKT